MQNNPLNAGGGLDFKKYIKLFKRKKFTIIISFIFLFLFTLAVAIKLGPKQIYSADSLLQFDDRRALSGVESRGRVSHDSKLGVLTSRTFLRNVVETLSLEFYVKGVNRFSAIDSVSVDDAYKEGRYRLEKVEDHLQLLYTSPDKSIEDKVVIEHIALSAQNIKYGGYDVYLRKDFFDNNKKLEFDLVRKDRAVVALRQSLQPSFKNRGKTLLEIRISGHDRHLITETLNTIIDEFIKQNLSVKKYNTSQVLEVLTSQLQTAKVDLDNANSALKRFRELNPSIGAAAAATGAVNNMALVETDKFNTTQKQNELTDLLGQYSVSSEGDKAIILNRILSFITANGAATAPALAADFERYTSERTSLRSSYGPSHPKVVDNEAKVQKIQSDIIVTAQSQLDGFVQHIAKLDNQIARENDKLKSLPEKEIRYIALQRKSNSAEAIYSDLLVRHKKAKIADAVEVGDIIILDRPIVPSSGSKLAFYMKYFLVAIIVGLGLSFGSVIAFDFFDKTVRTAEELEKLVTMRIVAKIPVVGDEKKVGPEDFDRDKKIDPKLVTADYSPTPMGEAYRSLRTQLLFSGDENKRNSIFITSLNPGEGKSLNAGNLAITFAQQKIPTLLVDADLRRGVLHSSFACNKKPGLSDFLYSTADITEENIRKIIQQTHIPNLYLLSSGMPVPNPSEILGSQRGKDVIKFLTERFGFVIVDTPPIMVTADSVVISQYVDSGLFVVRAGKTNIEEAKTKIEEYDGFQERMFGMVLNCAELDIKKENYKYSYYNY